MKNINLFALFCLMSALSVSQAVSAQWRRHDYSKQSDYYHFFYASVAGGYSSLHETNVSDVATTGDFGGLIGLGYEMRVKNFWLSIGVDAELLQNRSVISSSYKLQQDARDSQGKPIVMSYEVLNQSERNRWTYLNFPLMIGGYYNMFYAGAGVKFGIPVKSFNSTAINYTTSGTYSQYIEDFAEMNNHFYGNYDTLTYNDIKPNMNVSLAGEIGVDVLANVQNHNTFCNILKIGFYFEYGILSAVSHDKMNNDRISFPSENAAIITANPHYQWKSNVSSYACRPYFVGLKITYMFGGSKTQNSAIHHKGCMCYQ